MNDLIKAVLSDRIKGVRFDECMKKHTTMKAGGTAGAFVCVKESNQLINAIETAKSLNLPYRVIGNGSNIIIRDGGYNGLIIALGKLFGGGSKNENEATFGAGMSLFAVGMFCALNELSGLEWAFGIPGTVGGACYMNAGAYGHNWGEFVTKIEVYDGKEILIINKDELSFGYRSSTVKDKNLIVLSCTVKLSMGKGPEIQAKQMEYLQKRKSSQPLEFPSSGSVFKRNEIFYPAKAIDDLGLKGLKVGDAEISKKHAGFIINKKNATCQNIENLIQLITDKVYKSFGVMLEKEIEFFGDK
ncbi:MAG: UDP-N-acetylmuramate dehydrogenase [Clostridia bacterium]